MIDYLIQYENLADRPVLNSQEPAWTDENGNTFMHVTIFKEISPGDDENPPLYEYAPGYWLAVAASEVSDEIWDTMPAVHEVDRETGEILRTRLSPEQIAYGWQVSPVFAGSNYAFG